MHFQALQVREIVILFVKDMHYILQQLFRFFRLSCQKIKHSPCYFFLKPKLKETDTSLLACPWLSLDSSPSNQFKFNLCHCQQFFHSLFTNSVVDALNHFLSFQSPNLFLSGSLIFS